MTLPWHFIPDANNRLEIHPVEELQGLRYDERSVDSVRVEAGQDIVLEELSGSCMELQFAIDPGDTNTFGFKLFCSPDCEEETVITYDGTKKEFVIDFSNASLADDLEYPTLKQVVPFEPRSEGPLRFQVFVDRSVMEIFVNSQICMVQRVYPTREDSEQVRVFASDGSIVVSDILKWEMDATNPW
jgi:sucrose-6-phosphate hydrolase SacC (GH32 family)